jgi:hypothetical protein
MQYATVKSQSGTVKALNVTSFAFQDLFVEIDKRMARFKCILVIIARPVTVLCVRQGKVITIFHQVNEWNIEIDRWRKRVKLLPRKPDCAFLSASRVEFRGPPNHLRLPSAETPATYPTFEWAQGCVKKVCDSISKFIDLRSEEMTLVCGT